MNGSEREMLKGKHREFFNKRQRYIHNNEKIDSMGTWS